MYTKKFLLALLAVVILLGSLGSSLALAAESTESVTRSLSYQKRADVYLRKAGIFLPSSNYTGSVKFTRMEPTSDKDDKDLKFVERWADVRYYEADGDAFTRVFGLNYIYFNLNRTEAAAWKAGDLGIYFYDTTKKDWVACSAFLVEDKSSDYGRLTCVFSQFGLYGLAEDK